MVRVMLSTFPTVDLNQFAGSAGLNRILRDETVISTWRIKAFLDKGGNGEVYKVEHIRTGRKAALKILHNTEISSRRRFELESEVLQTMAIAEETVSGSAFPKILDHGSYGEMNLPFVVMEFLYPFNLPKETTAIGKFICTICSATTALHDSGYYHRDLKSGNIMCRKNGDPVIIDFGCAIRIQDASEYQKDRRLSMVTGGFLGVGTEGSSAPEQFLGKNLSPSTDVYAIGELLSECFDGDVPDAWSPIVRKATAAKHENRYSNPAEMSSAVKRLVFRLRTMPILIGVGIIAIIALVYTILSLNRPYSFSNPHHDSDGDYNYIERGTERDFLRDGELYR